jgi:hypothetical protein
MVAAAGTFGALVSVPPSGANTSTVGVESSVPRTLITGVPFVRVHFTEAVPTGNLPPLRTVPFVATTWRAIGPRDYAAYGALPATRNSLRVAVPTGLTCVTSTSCTWRSHDVAIDVPVNAQWLHALLATAGYLPVSFTSDSGAAPVRPDVTGRFTWRFSALPSLARALWQPNVVTEMTTAALMSFQDEHHLATTGIASHATLEALVAMVNDGQHSARSWNYVDVTEQRPERATLFVDGVPTISTLANTGVRGADTALGSYAVYLHIPFQWMTGHNLDGSAYRDPVNWISYFNGGDALHEFYRYSYGWPQSLGCVEMPHGAAMKMWPFTPVGTLVTVHD